jgi:hypothetical protein
MAEVKGFSPAKTNQKPEDIGGSPVFVGVWGDSTTGVGVFGTSGAVSQSATNIPIINNAGVVGHSIEDTGGAFGAGVWGESIQGQGVVGRSQSNNGVLGVTFGQPPNAGVFGSSTTGGNGVVGFVGDAAGVVGNSINGPGVQGISGTGNAVVGQSFGADGRAPGAGVLGTSENVGVWGTSRAGIAVRGDCINGEGLLGYSVDGFGVYGVSSSNSGVVGHTDGASAAGIFGESSGSGFAGFFNGVVGISGNLAIAGTIFKSGGGYMIDHPLDPGNKYLRHSFVESPDMLNVHNGNVTTDANGEVTVVLPHYFEATNQDFRYQLTVIGKFAQAIVAHEIRNNQFTIKTDQPEVKVSWQVTGIRRDPWAVANRIAVEEEKAPEDKGRYLHPELWRRPKEEHVHNRVVVGAQRLAGGHRPEEPARIDRSRVEEDWRQMQELVRRMNPGASPR